MSSVLRKESRLSLFAAVRTVNFYMLPCLSFVYFLFQPRSFLACTIGGKCNFCLRKSATFPGTLNSHPLQQIQHRLAQIFDHYSRFFTLMFYVLYYNFCVVLHNISYEINENPHKKTLKNGRISGPRYAGPVVGGAN